MDFLQGKLTGRVGTQGFLGETANLLNWNGSVFRPGAWFSYSGTVCGVNSFAILIVPAAPYTDHIYLGHLSAELSSVSFFVRS